MWLDFAASLSAFVPDPHHSGHVRVQSALSRLGPTSPRPPPSRPASSLSAVSKPVVARQPAGRPVDRPTSNALGYSLELGAKCFPKPRKKIRMGEVSRKYAAHRVLARLARLLLRSLRDGA
ncbi:hypothetical protein HPB50_023407 [Hyalomma asiaticum]|uniref:Uncharacterized protein n=1 Tax=Hyalomma asiaticum TaxID=266040 RepID=A0ACB7S8P5_HYAAI|nr:hypothetical protein HPB50_023407 [Hyalomma asiaticum]